MKKWYKSINDAQRIFLFLASAGLSLLIVGLLPLAILIYLELGERFEQKDNKESEND